MTIEGGGFDPQALLAQAMEMQQRLMDAQAEAMAETVEGSAGGGKVTVTMRGTGEVLAVRIDPSVVVPEEVDLLEDLVLAALHDAASQVADLAQGQMGVDIGSLGGLFGGSDGASSGLAGLAGLFGEQLEQPAIDVPPRPEQEG